MVRNHEDGTGPGAGSAWPKGNGRPASPLDEREPGVDTRVYADREAQADEPHERRGETPSSEREL